MALDSTALSQLSEKMKAKQQQAGPMSTKQLTWIADGYNLGYLAADEAKARFSQLVDELEQKKGEV